MEYRLRRADGEYRWLLDSGVPRFEPGGVFAGYIGSCIDITDSSARRKRDLPSRNWRAWERWPVALPTISITFWAVCSLTRNWRWRSLPVVRHPTQELQRIRAAAIRGAEIVRQLMIYAGQESEVLELVDVSLDRGRDARVAQGFRVEACGTVETILAKGLPAVRANPSQLRQVVMNLITNASEAIGDRDGVILVTTGQVKVGRESPAAYPGTPAEGDYLQLQVSDTGRGMTAETRARIFDPFFTTRHGGPRPRAVRRARDCSEPPWRHPSGKRTGQGHNVPDIAALCRQMRLRPPARLRAPRRRKLVTRAATVLVVEDEDSLRKPRHDDAPEEQASPSSRQATVMSRWTRSVHTKAHIDVLLLDISLPGVPSRQVFEEARLLIPAAVVIITSAYSREHAAAALSATITHFIRKPYRINDLVNLIREAVI